MDFRILGPLEVEETGRAIPIVGKQRLLLAILLLHANEPVSTDALMEELWGEHPPLSARKGLQVYVSRLRGALGGSSGRVVTQPTGYLIHVEPDELDLDRCEHLAHLGRQALLEEDWARAGEHLREALALWRGPPLADFIYESFAQAEIGRLEELRLALLEDRIEADLGGGRHAELVGELEALVREHPLRERLRRQLVLALYRCDRQVEALEAYRAARATLDEELGLEPTPALRELEQAILTHDAGLRAPAAPAPSVSRLPAPPTPTIGRDVDRRAVLELFHSEDHRLVTLTGPGGVGKTRLALDVAIQLEPQYPDGAWLVSLAATAESEHVPSAIAQALGVTPERGESARAACELYLRPKRGILVLDNFEHLLAAAPLVGDFLVACPGLRVLATSREALQLQAEQRYAVSPLRVPEDGAPEAVEQAPASALFVERAHSRNSAFELTTANAQAIASVCRRLDGLPLAVELAAARMAVLGPEELDARLARALDALGSGPRDAPARHQTLRATLEWSHRLLSAPEGEAFARFAAFAGGATVETAEDVTGADIEALEGLVEKSLLQRESGRLLMLETVRSYARELLDRDDRGSEVRLRHCRHFVALAESAAPHLRTHAEPEWMRRLDAEVDNFRAALDWALREGQSALAVRLAGRLGRYWEFRGASAEGGRWLRAALEAADEHVPLEDRARALRAEVVMLEEQGSQWDIGGSRAVLQRIASEALALSRRAGDPAGIADALLHLGQVDPDDAERERAGAEEALPYARESGDEGLIADALSLRLLSFPIVDVDAEIAETAALYRKVGDVHGLASLYNNASYAAIEQGSYECAAAYLDEALVLAERTGEQLRVMLVFENLGLAALFMTDLERAMARFADGLRLCRQHGVPWAAAEAIAGVAAVAARQGEFERAARLLGAAESLAELGDVVSSRLEQEFYLPARERFGETRWRAAYADGARLSFDEAVSLALDAGA
jgi:predicted ATPase/DNA-binding SARP family transcriptional activator/tetratricopeptide (TPR) repeat protein